MRADPGPGTTPEASAPAPVCPWCSASLPAGDTRDCPACGARLIEEADVDLPGVTEVDPALLAAAAAPRKVKRTFGALLVGSDDNEIPPPTEAEMPALARPDVEVRKEMLRLELEARLTALQAEAKALAAEERAGEEPVPPGSGAPEPGA